MAKRFKSSLAKKLGANIAAHRKALRLTQERLAEALKLETMSVSRYETGTALPSLPTLEALSNLLNVSVADLLEGDDPQDFKELNRLGVAVRNLSEKDREYVISSAVDLARFLSTRKPPARSL